MQVDEAAVLSLLRPMVHLLSAPPAAAQRTPAFLLPAAHPGLLQTQHSTLSRASLHSNQSSGSGKGWGLGTASQEAAAAAAPREGAGGEVVEEGLLGEG
jgi:hypothetical protein